MTIKTTKNRADQALVDATIKYSSGLFQFLIGVLPAQVELLRSRDEQEVREICDSKSAVLLPSLRRTYA